MDIASIAKLMGSGGDLPSAAKAMGMAHRTIAPVDPTNADAVMKRIDELENEFAAIAQIAQQPKTEVIALSGSPGMLKGKKVLILAVLLDAEKSS
jgi:hypothetical protein